ncbi:hypothetical protein [Parasitella parasitica]|uniref:Uncharacterized protein n=1 Tax=Parasitella parasitica TaxID=35722 RepID=A0A0B7N8Y2_9FUNG|nr:hypothetical protein [Parasitella parasitica]
MSTSATTATATSRAIDVIVSLHDEIEPVKFKFLSKRLNWDNLVSLIQSSSTLEPPIVLYYKLTFDGVVESLENQEDLTQLLAALKSPTALRFYGNQEQVTSPVFMSSTAAFTRLGSLVEQNKQVVQSSRRIARWVGILASMMSTIDKSFEHEFQVLESMIQRKSIKLQRRRNPENKPVETDGVISIGENEEFVEASEVIDLDARLEDLDIGDHGDRHRKHGGCGRRFGGPGAFGVPGVFGGRPRPNVFFEGFHNCPSGKFGSYGGFGDLNDSDKAVHYKFAWAAGGRHHHGRPHSFSGPINSDEEPLGSFGFDKFGGRHYHGKFHPFGGPFGGLGPRPFSGASDSEEELLDQFHRKKFGGHGRGGRDGRRFGHRGPRPPSNGDEELFGGRGFGKRARYSRFH